ncbi:MAG: LPS export ABC transporter periplasmic protein LptC, partial [Tannerellaceae bacterium]
LVGNVHIENVDGTKFDSQELYLDERNDKVSSTKLIRIEQKDGSITTGVGFESNMAMTDYHILSAAGEFIVSETTNDTTMTANEATDSIAITTDSIKK